MRNILLVLLISLAVFCLLGLAGFWPGVAFVISLIVGLGMLGALTYARPNRLH
jgi:hypothetical protein